MLTPGDASSAALNLQEWRARRGAAVTHVRFETPAL